MISFIWSSGNRLPAGTGGSENYTVGQVRELTRRGIPAQVVTVGLGTSDGRDGFAGVPFLSLPTLAKVGDLDGTVVFVNEPHVVPTKYPAFLILHNPPPIRERQRAFAIEGTRERALIVTSRYAAALWSGYLDVDIATISVVYPFAEPGFAAQPRPARDAGKTLMARHDIVVMPSNSQYWHETFGIVSIEAQHSGCRVVTSDDGGLPETDCDGIVLVSPDNAEALA